MDAAWWDRVQEIFVEAAKLPHDERAALLDRACSDDEQRREVESRLEQEPGDESDAPTLGGDARTIDVVDIPPATSRRRGEMIAGRYEVVGKLGAGGMGQVLKVRDHKVSGRLVALKRILHIDDQARDRFQREIDAAAHLNHRNICKIYECGEDEQGPYFTMELLSGGSLSERVKRDGPLTGQDLLDLARQLAQALRYAHRKGIQHRDIKPSNVIFGEDGDPKLADFGLVRMGPSSDLSVSNQGLGTLDYSAPEQLRNSKAADHRADIYSLGATVYFTLTGKAPVAMLDQAAIPQPWRTMILKCMQEDPSDRYFDAEEILTYLDKTPTSSSFTVSDRCSQCGAANPAGSSFCHQCGAGLNEPCPNCRAQNRAGAATCQNCQIDIPKRRASDKLLQEAIAHRDKGQHRRAARAANEALRHEPDRKEPKAILAESQESLQRFESLRTAALEHESTKHYAEATNSWRQLLDIDSENREATEGIERVRGEGLNEQFHRKLEQVRAVIDERNLGRATSRLQELRAIAAPDADRYVPQSEQAIAALRHELDLEQRNNFETALSRGDWNGARAALGELGKLHVEQVEVAGFLNRLNEAERTGRRWRAIRRVGAGVVVLVVLAGGYLLFAGWYNDNLEGQAAAALHRGDLPDVKFLPGRRSLDADLAARLQLCVALDERYNSLAWRHEVDESLFHIGGESTDLVAAYDWFILQRIATATGGGSQQDVEEAMQLVGKIELVRAGSHSELFRKRQEDVELILKDWYVGTLPLGPFSDPNFVGDPRTPFVRGLNREIRDAATGCERIADLQRVLSRLDEADNSAALVATHNQNVVDEARLAFDQDRMTDMGVRLGRICEQPVTVATLIADWNDAMFLQLEQAFQDGGAVDKALAKLGDLGQVWSYLDRTAVESLQWRMGKLREIAAHRRGERLSVALLCRLGSDSRDELWDTFLQQTQTLAIDEFKGRELQRVGNLIALLRALDHRPDVLVDLELRVIVAGSLVDLAGLLPELTHDDLNNRVFDEDLASNLAADLARAVVIEAIESEVFDAASRLAGEFEELHELGNLARRVSRRTELSRPELVALEGQLRSDSTFPNARQLVAALVETRLRSCLEGVIAIDAPGQLSLHPRYDVARLSITPTDGSGSAIVLDPLGNGVYRVPYMKEGQVVLTLESPHGGKVVEPFTLRHSTLDNPGVITFREAEVVAGRSATLQISPLLPLIRVEVNGQAYGAQDLVNEGDRWALDVPSSLTPDQLAETQHWPVRLVTSDGTQSVDLSIDVVSEIVADARIQLDAGKFNDVFVKINASPRSHHEAVTKLVSTAGKGWFAELGAAEPETSEAANDLMIRCRQFRAVVYPDDLHEQVGKFLETAWIRRIDLTTTWDSVSALDGDLAFLKDLRVTGKDLPGTVAWLEGAQQWAEPIVAVMRKHPSDWTTVAGTLSAGSFPAVLVHRSTGLEFVYVPEGRFRIGGASGANAEKPHRWVTVPGFYLARTEVTNAAWADQHDPAGVLPDNALHAKSMVSFEDARQWCIERGLDLPTEAQWELAAGGQGSLEFPWGDRKCRPNVKSGFRRRELAEVGSFECDESAWCGAMDMAGNVSEWCYPVSNATYRVLVDGSNDPPWNGLGLIWRGSSYLGSKEEGMSCFRRKRYTPLDVAGAGGAQDDIGFRPVISRQ